MYKPIFLSLLAKFQISTEQIRSNSLLVPNLGLCPQQSAAIIHLAQHLLIQGHRHLLYLDISSTRTYFEINSMTFLLSRKTKSCRGYITLYVKTSFMEFTINGKLSPSTIGLLISFTISFNESKTPITTHISSSVLTISAHCGTTTFNPLFKAVKN